MRISLALIRNTEKYKLSGSEKPRQAGRNLREVRSYLIRIGFKIWLKNKAKKHWASGFQLLPKCVQWFFFRSTNQTKQEFSKLKFREDIIFVLARILQKKSEIEFRRESCLTFQQKTYRPLFTTTGYGIFSSGAPVNLSTPPPTPREYLYPRATAFRFPPSQHQLVRGGRGEARGEGRWEGRGGGRLECTAVGNGSRLFTSYFPLFTPCCVNTYCSHCSLLLPLLPLISIIPMFAPSCSQLFPIVPITVTATKCAHYSQLLTIFPQLLLLLFATIAPLLPIIDNNCYRGAKTSRLRQYSTFYQGGATAHTNDREEGWGNFLFVQTE